MDEGGAIRRMRRGGGGRPFERRRRELRDDAMHARARNGLFRKMRKRMNRRRNQQQENEGTPHGGDYTRVGRDGE